MGGRGVESGTTAVHHLCIILQVFSIVVDAVQDSGPQIGREMSQVLRNCAPAPLERGKEALFGDLCPSAI